MCRRFLYTLVLALFFSASSLSAQDCGCPALFEKLQSAVEENYSLFSFKVREDNRKAYRSVAEAIKQSAAQAADMNSCFELLKAYVSYFNDGHLSIRERGIPSFENLPYDSTFVLEYYKKQKGRLHPLEGIWKTTGYTLAVLREQEREGRDFVGVVLDSENENWKAGDVKLELTEQAGKPLLARYFMGDHSPWTVEAGLEKEYLLKLSYINRWLKVYPVEDPGSLPSLEEALRDDSAPSLEMLDEESVLIRFPSFGGAHADRVARMIADNHEKLIRARYLIVDIRDNGGGSDYTYFPVLPYIYTGPVQMPQVGYYLSEENARRFKSFLDIPEEGEPDEKTLEYLRLLDTYRDTFLTFSEENSVHALDTLYSNPRKVAILMNEGSGSSAETFVYRCRQSDKVTLYGENTAGVIDGFNGHSLDLGCITLQYPTCVRTMDILTDAIDPYGIEPDIFLDTELDNIVSLVLRHLKLMD